MMQQIQYLKSKKYHLLFKEYLDDMEHGSSFSDPINLEKYCISVFDHWLDEQEARDEIITFYSLIISLEANAIKEADFQKTILEYYVKEMKLMSFYLSLYSDFKIIFYDYDKDQFYKCKDLEKYFEMSENSIREKRFLGRCSPEFFIPELKTVIIGNFDFTPVIYCKGEKNFLRLKEYIEKSSLHILS